MITSKRYRVNLSTSTKGVVTSDQTVEIISTVSEEGEEEIDLKALILAETDELHTALVAKYPVKII